MSENLHQSGAKNGDSMDPMDTAQGWVKLYELKTGRHYEPGSQYSRHEKGHLGSLPGPFLQIAEEISADKHTVWELLKLLEQPEFVQQAVREGLPRTYVREADKAPHILFRQYHFFRF